MVTDAVPRAWTPWRPTSGPYQAVAIDSGIWAEFLREGWGCELVRLTRGGVPHDAELVGLQGGDDMRLYAIFSHPSWTFIPALDPIPVREGPTYEKHDGAWGV